jgi:cellulose synthase/poly-beta-1,6-N-acetylglucosamine synthase-like glycosyltransferase
MVLSVIIPAYNEAKYIGKTLERIKECEVIVVCNGCTDKTASVARKYTNKVIELKEKGVSRARNEGVKHASHKRVVFLDADIRVGPNVLQKIAQSRYTVGTCRVRAASKRWFARALMRGKSLSHPFGYCTGLAFCDKMLFYAVGGFDETVAVQEDGKFLRAAKAKGQYGVVDGYVYNNMRRYHHFGYWSLSWWWTKSLLTQNKTEYQSIR